MTTSDDQFSSWTKKKLQSTSQSQTCTKKGLGHLFIWWSAACLIRYSFLNPGKITASEKYAQQIDEIHQKLQHLQLASVNRKGPILLDNAWPHIAQIMLQKLNELVYDVLPHPPYLLDLLASDYQFFKQLNFLQGKCFHNHQEAEKAFQEFIKSWSMDFYATGINKLISHWQKWEQKKWEEMRTENV